jgi:hypothetical protein
MATVYEAVGYKPERGYFAGCFTRKSTQDLKARMMVDLAALFRASGKKVRSIARGLSLPGVGCIGIETAQWVRRPGGNLTWEVRTWQNKRYRRMIVGRVSPDRRSILDFLYLDAVPKTKYNFRVTDEMLTRKPRGTAEEVAAAVLGL